jgi:hypothetical protein
MGDVGRRQRAAEEISLHGVAPVLHVSLGRFPVLNALADGGDADVLAKSMTDRAPPRLNLPNVLSGRKNCSILTVRARSA